MLHLSGIIQFLSFCVWLISLSTNFSQPSFDGHLNVFCSLNSVVLQEHLNPEFQSAVSVLSCAWLTLGSPKQILSFCALIFLGFAYFKNIKQLVSLEYGVRACSLSAYSSQPIQKE